jgi:ABC-2 type transport system permease protein
MQELREILSAMAAQRDKVKDVRELLLDMAERVVKAVSQEFACRQEEVAILLLSADGCHLRFVAPRRFAQIGSIPLTKRDSIAVTVLARRAGEVNNNVPTVKHVAFFEVREQAGQVACLAFGVFYVISAFYFAKDINLLIPMPLRPGEIVVAKFLSILLGEYMTLLPIITPAIVIYGLFGGVAWTFIPYAIIIFLLLPIVPLVLSSLFSMVLMRVTNLRRNRDLWRVLGALIGVGLGFLFNFLSRYGARNGRFGGSVNQMQAVLEQQKQTIHAISRFFPTSTWAANALKAGSLAEGIVPFLTFTVVALIALAVMVWVAEKLFYGGAVGGEESRRSGKVLSRAELAKETEQARTPLWALFMREVKLLNRTPAFLMAALMPIIIMPAMMAFSLFQDQELGNVVAKAPSIAASPLVPLFGVGAILFLNSIANVGATAVSREGRHFWISRSLPVAPRVQAQAKMLHGLIFSTINILMVLGAMAYLGLLSPLTVVYLVLGGFLSSAATGYAAIMVDLIRPNLKWTDPQQAMKGNYNVLFGMLFNWVLIGVIALVGALLYAYAKPLLMPAVIVLFGAMAALLWPAVGAMADRRYLEIED